MPNNNDITEKEIRGITFKNLMWIMGGIFTLLVTVLLTYGSIDKTISTNSASLKNMSDKINELKESADKNDKRQWDEINEHYKRLNDHDSRLYIIEDKLKIHRR